MRSAVYRTGGLYLGRYQNTEGLGRLPVLKVVWWIYGNRIPERTAVQVIFARVESSLLAWTPELMELHFRKGESRMLGAASGEIPLISLEFR